MDRKILAFIGLIVFGFSLNYCQQQNEIIPVNGEVELYLLDYYEIRDSTNFQIDKNTVRTQFKPLLIYPDFISYNPKEYTFKISDRARIKIKGLDHYVHGLAFAFTANNKIIYTGYFWPSYSSMSCDWIVIDPFMINEKNEMMIRIGYPGLAQGINIPDKRNDQQLLDIFRRDDKLIE
jgi:hypothetical protein